MHWLTAELHNRFDVRYWLSKVVPIRMRSSYTVSDGSDRWAEKAVWWQWRGRVVKMVSCERVA